MVRIWSIWVWTMAGPSDTFLMRRFIFCDLGEVHHLHGKKDLANLWMERHVYQTKIISMRLWEGGPPLFSPFDEVPFWLYRHIHTHTNLLSYDMIIWQCVGWICNSTFYSQKYPPWPLAALICLSSTCHRILLHLSTLQPPPI